MTISVRARIFLLAILPVLILALPVFFYFPQQVETASRAGLESKLGNAGRLLGHALGHDRDLLAGDPKHVASLVAGLQVDGDVTRAGVYSAEGAFLAGLRLDAKTAPSVQGALRQGTERSIVEREGELRLISRILADDPSGAPQTVGYLLIDVSLERVQSLQASQRMTTLLVAVIALALGMLAALLLGSRISSHLTEAARVAEEVGQGNLGITVPPAQGDDELSRMLASLGRMVGGLRALEAQATAVARRDLSGETTGAGDLHQAFNTMVGQQRELVHELSETATELETSSHEILATLRDQEAGANEQASAVEEARRTMLSLLQASSKIASAAKTVHANAQRTQESSAETAERTNQLNQLTARIADVLTGITKIADRSDILALNAALEGTKAGEAGKGFILVAEEMRRLAENVLESVRDISELVEAIREASQASVLATEQGVKLSLETADSANQIRLTSQQQQSGTEMATQSMNEISQILTQALGGARQTTGAVEELSQRASRLRQALSEYVLEDGSPSA